MTQEKSSIKIANESFASVAMIRFLRMMATNKT
jgi:hypothetical protein